jgi:hypothetical protein
MKKLLISFIILFLFYQGYSQQTGDTIISNNPQNLKVKVLYFHITNRCHTCFSIEANVRKTVYDHFEAALDTGTVGLTVMNCELPENAAIVKKYNAYGATLALTSYKDGKEVTSVDLTNWAFQKIHDPDVFISELKFKIDKLLK